MARAHRVAAPHRRFCILTHSDNRVLTAKSTVLPDAPGGPDVFPLRLHHSNQRSRKNVWVTQSQEGLPGLGSSSGCATPEN